MVGFGYALVLLIRFAQKNYGVKEIYLVLGFIAFEELLLNIDLIANKLMAKISYPMFAYLRSFTLSRFLDQDLAWHQSQTSGKLAAQANQGVGKMVQSAEGLARDVFGLSIQTGLTLVPLILFSKYTAPIFLLALGLFVWLNQLEGRARAASRLSRFDAYARDSGIFTEYIQAAEPISLYRRKADLMQGYGELQQQIVETGLNETKIGNKYSAQKNRVLGYAKAICMGIWIWQLRAGQLDMAMWWYVYGLMNQLLTSVWGYASLFDALQEALQPIRLWLNLIEAEPKIRPIDELPGEEFSIPDQVGIEFANVEFSYTNGKKVMKNFNLQIEPGKITGIVGHTGGGKTTLRNLACRLYDIQSGQITISGRDIKRWPLDRLRGLYSFVFQGGAVFFSNTTVAETLKFTRPSASTAEIETAAQAACIHEDILAMPQGYQTLIGEHGVNLSGGQKQRFALAQALLSLPDRKIFILDEFTSQLDSFTESKILQNLKENFPGRTVVIIAHRLSTILNIADKIMVLSDGEIVEQGSHAELVANGRFYADLARLQAIA